MSTARTYDLATSEGGISYIADLFALNLKRSDFTTYIENKLASDFACVLSRYMFTLHETVDAERIRADVAVGDCNDAEALLDRALNALIHVAECYGLEPATLARIEAIVEDHAQGDGLSNLEGVVHTGIDESPTTHCNRCDGSGREPAKKSQGDPVKVVFSALSYGAKYKYEADHGPDKVYVKIGHDLVAAWDERLATASWRGQGICSFAGGDSKLSDAVYLVRDSDINVTQALGEIIEQQRLLIVSLREELVESYRIGAIRPPAAPRHAIPCRKFAGNRGEVPACWSDCPCDIPDFTPGSGNSARRRMQAIEKGCPQPQAHPARCGCEDKP